MKNLFYEPDLQHTSARRRQSSDCFALRRRGGIFDWFAGRQPALGSARGTSFI